MSFSQICFWDVPPLPRPGEGIFLFVKDLSAPRIFDNYSKNLMGRLGFKPKII
jgi:hypothetical protein